MTLAAVLMFCYYVQPYVLTSAKMEEPVPLQISAPALVDGLGILAVKVCHSMHYVITSNSKQMLSCLLRCMLQYKAPI